MKFLFMEALAARVGILMNDFLMHLAVYGFSMFLTGLYVVAKLHGNDSDICELGVAMILGLLVFVVMRGDFFIHRFAGYIRDFAQGYLAFLKEEVPNLETISNIPDWEGWKGTRKNTWMVGAMDGVAGMYLLFLLTKFQKPLWQQGETIFVIVTSILALLLGIGGFLIPKQASK